MDPPSAQRVLIVENSRSYAGLLAEVLEQRLHLPIARARSLAEAEAALAAHPDLFLVLSGLVLPDAAPPAVIERLSQTGLPLVVVSGTYDEALRDRIIGRSVVDYVIKSAPGHFDYLVWLVQRLDRNRRIAALVVDDSPTARLLVAELLSSYGFRVLLAANGEDGLRALEQDPGIRLVITDHEMPGLTGVELSAKLRERYARDRLAIIGVSGAHRPELVAQFLKNGANDRMWWRASVVRSSWCWPAISLPGPRASISKPCASVSPLCRSNCRMAAGSRSPSASACAARQRRVSSLCTRCSTKPTACSTSPRPVAGTGSNRHPRKPSKTPRVCRLSA